MTRPAIKPEREPREPWPEAQIIAEPIREKDLDGPRVLVRRRQGNLVGPRGEDLAVFPAEPVISLFTGAGGMDIGVEQAGMATVCQVEWWQPACETLLMNRPRFFRHAALIQADIRTLPTEVILRESGLRVGEAWLVCGGPPCQGFSGANSKSHSGTYDARNDLVYEFLRVVREVQPRHFIMENVPGFVRFNKGEYFKQFLATAYGAFYELVYGLVDAVEHGVPQYRCRFFCAGTRRDVWAIEGLLGGLPPPQTFHEADRARLRKLVDPFDEEYRSLTRAPGIRYFPDRPVLVPPAPISHGRNTVGRAKNFREFYDRLAREEPDRLVTTSPA